MASKSDVIEVQGGAFVIPGAVCSVQVDENGGTILFTADGRQHKTALNINVVVDRIYAVAREK